MRFPYAAKIKFPFFSSALTDLFLAGNTRDESRKVILEYNKNMIFFLRHEYKIPGYVQMIRDFRTNPTLKVWVASTQQRTLHAERV